MVSPHEPIRLYAVNTANSQRVAIALEELALPYAVHLVDRAAGEQHQPAYRAINPTGLTPTLVDPSGPDGTPITVAQSGAILVYLAEQTGRLLPRAPAARTLALQWLMHVLADVNATASVLFFAQKKIAPPHGVTVDLFEQRLLTFLADCDRALAHSDHLAGGLGIADIALYPTVAARRDWIAEHGLQHLVRWAGRMAALPSMAAGMKALAG